MTNPRVGHPDTHALLDRARRAAAADYPSVRDAIGGMLPVLAVLVGQAHVAAAATYPVIRGEANAVLRVRIPDVIDRQRTVARLAGEATNALVKLSDHLDAVEHTLAELDGITMAAPVAAPDAGAGRRGDAHTPDASVAQIAATFGFASVDDLYARVDRERGLAGDKALVTKSSRTPTKAHQ